MNSKIIFVIEVAVASVFTFLLFGGWQDPLIGAAFGAILAFFELRPRQKNMSPARDMPALAFLLLLTILVICIFLHYSPALQMARPFLGAFLAVQIFKLFAWLFRKARKNRTDTTTVLASLVAMTTIIVSALIAVRPWTVMPGKSYSGPLPALSGSQETMRTELESHVRQVATVIGERNWKHRKELAQTVDYIKSSFAASGYKVQDQEFDVQDQKFQNIIAEKRGQSRPDEIVLVGAHYDSATGSPAANDNGTGVAAVLCMADYFKDRSVDRTIRFVAFACEEPPFFGTAQMGSYKYAQACLNQKDKVVAMLALETLGYYRDEPGSQYYPPLAHLFYPDRANFVTFVGVLSAGPLIRRCIRSFRQKASFPSEGGAAPWWLPGIDWSDHKNFSAAGYQALMVTDTALFRYPYYHTPQDTPEHLDYSRLALVTSGLCSVVQDLASSGPER